MKKNSSDQTYKKLYISDVREYDWGWNLYSCSMQDVSEDSYNPDC